MKTRLLCPACGASYQVDKARLAGAARLTCGQCGERWVMRPPGPEARPTSPPAASPAARGRAPRTRATAPKAAPPATGSLEALCPQCGHVFPFQPPSSARSRRRVLVCEDQEYFCQLIKESLGEEFETVVVHTAPAALKEIARCTPDLLVLDLVLADGGDGREVLEKRADRTFPVLIFTSRDEQEIFGKQQWDELKAVGANDILIKGINVGDDLQRKVEELLGAR